MKQKKMATESLKNEHFIRADVQFLVDYLEDKSISRMVNSRGCDVHGLPCYAIKNWDQKDWSNYHDMVEKATSSLSWKYALFGNDVAEADKYTVTSAPGKFFDSYEEAEALLDERSKKNTRIYGLWIINEVV